MSYRVPFINYPRHYHLMETEIDAAIKEVLNGGDLILREHVRRFERDMASFLGVAHGVGLNSCTDAMRFSLLAAGIGPGDEVITVAHTFVATIAAIVHCGAVPVLVDIGEDFNMDTSRLEAAVTPRTRAVLPVHLNGRLCDMETLMDVARRHNLAVIEDAAQALGGTFDGKKAGSFGLTGCFSFYPAKLLGAFGDAGILVTDDEEVAEKARLYRDHGRATKDELALYGFNSRPDNLQAAILNVKLRHVPRWIERRRELAARYDRGLSGLPGIQVPPGPAEDGRHHDVYQNYVIRAAERDRLAAHLGKAGVETIISWPIPNHRQKALGLGNVSLPETERASREVISLPLFPELEDDQVAYVIDVIREFSER